MFKSASSFRWLACPGPGSGKSNSGTPSVPFGLPHRWRFEKRPPAYWIPAILALLWILSTGIWAERLPMRFYTTADGLWTSYINYIMRDSHGFIWLCTRDGLSRFDGYRFTNYRISGGAASQNFTYIFEDRRGVLWMVLNGNREYRYDPASLTNSYQPPRANQTNSDGRVLLRAELASSQFLSGILQDREGNLWAGGAGLFRVEEKAGRLFFHEVNLNLPQAWRQSFGVTAVAEGADGSLWLATVYGVLRRLPDGRVVHYKLDMRPGAEDVRLLLADKQGYIWIWATRPWGLHAVKPEPLSALAGLGSFSSHRLPSRPPAKQAPLPAKAGEAVDFATVDALGGAKEIGEIHQQSKGPIWLTTNDRLVVFDGREFHSFGDARGAARLIEDLDGDLWMTITHGGVAKLSLRGFTSYSAADGLGAQEDASLHHNIASIQEDHDGRLHVVTSGWLINRLNDNQFRSVRPNIPAADKLWTSTLGFLDHTGQWWLLTSRGLYRFPRTQNLEDLAQARPILYTQLDGLPSQWAYCMFEDSRGDLWISTRDTDRGTSGLVRWQRSSQTFHKLTEEDGLPPMKSAASFAEDRAGNLWFGFYEGGLVRYSESRFTSFTDAGGLPEGFITALHIDHLGRLWLTSTSDGLARIDDPTAEHPHFVHYTTREGLASNNARALTESFAGDMYIGTVRGVDRLTPETGKIRHYASADGLEGEFITTAYRDHTGTLWFGSFDGLSRIDPQPEPIPAPPSIRIEGLRIAGVAQPLSELGASALSGIELSATEKNLQIDFSSLSMARAGLLRYQYKLQGVDDDWSAPTDQRTVQLANLAPGKYLFLVRAVDSSGAGSARPATVSFRILPPFWQRWWFLGLVATAIAGVFTLLYRYRVTHLLEVERVRTRIATDLHDDIGSSLSQIAVLSEVVRRQVDGAAAVAQPLSTIASTSRELVDSMSDIVWAINPHRDNFGDLAQRMRRFGSDLFTGYDIEFRFNAGQTEHAMKLGADVRRQIFLIFKESSHNIVRHSGCSRVLVDLHIENHAITLSLKDDGKGFDVARESQGHGLASMSRRAKGLDASLEIGSQPGGGGTVVSLKVPLGRHVTR